MQVWNVLWVTGIRALYILSTVPVKLVLDWFRGPYHKGLLSKGSTKTAFIASGSSENVLPVQTDYRLLIEFVPIFTHDLQANLPPVS